MQGIAIWSMHFIANRAITLLNGQPELQIVYSVRTRAPCSGMHWCAALGTRYTLRHVPASGESNASRNTTVIALVCLSVAASCVMITTAVCPARTRKRYAAKAQQIVLAAAVFDDRGRILVSPDGLLPSETITETFPQKSANDIFSTAHPLFHWMYRASRNWSNVATLLDWMRTHLNRLSSGGGRGMRSVKLVQENGQLVQNYDMIFRELFCIAASTLSYRLGEVLVNAGALWDEIFVTGTAGEPRPLTRLGTTVNGIVSPNGTDVSMQSKAGDAQARHDLLETGVRQSQDLIGRGCLLVLVRHLSAPREIARLEASGFQFAEPCRVVDIIRSSMQIRTRRLEEKLLDMATYKEDKAEVEPGVYLGIFALRARLDRFGFDVLVNRESRNALPMVPLGLEKLERWHHDFLRSLDGMPVPTLLRQLELNRGRSRLEDQFAAQLRGGISTLQTSEKRAIIEQIS
ncbi:uncharacterized protein B0I36DRAFT_60818 [Microdochium trichocladiopsis]|uniref:Uncharacterized protein n=1 Tax=Microdochium trichocladiopsis TaxID=1682393 RepID=A0A9P8XPE1_9PEZI|nr:uncharacterized protein B0I36DRAFT_60818 [Microdochium trichocladiopsis]KAH7009259.1 hypothetical protein B0I36DRAFT_60818 [Microdochium trichocladiopsis]